MWSNCDEYGFVLTGPDLIHNGRPPKAYWPLDRDPYLFESSMPGLFAVGDVRANSVKRVASAVGEGSVAVQFIHQSPRQGEMNGTDTRYSDSPV